MYNYRRGVLEKGQSGKKERAGFIFGGGTSLKCGSTLQAAGERSQEGRSAGTAAQTQQSAIERSPVHGLEAVMEAKRGSTQALAGAPKRVQGRGGGRRTAASTTEVALDKTKNVGRGFRLTERRGDEMGRVQGRAALRTGQGGQGILPAWGAGGARRKWRGRASKRGGNCSKCVYGTWAPRKAQCQGRGRMGSTPEASRLLKANPHNQGSGSAVRSVPAAPFPSIGGRQEQGQGCHWLEAAGWVPAA